MQSRDTTRIGKHFVVNECITSAKDSAQDLKEQKFEVLCQRFKTFGYLAFSSFFPESMSKELLAEITRVVGSERVASFEANLTTGFGDSERARAWKKVGSSVIVAKYYSNPLLQSTLKNILQHDKRLVVPPENLLFQLSWVRGKAPGDATSVHVDYYHVQQPEELGLPGLRTDDVLEEDDFKSFNVWTRLSEGPGNTSCLAVIPGSHLMEFDEAAKRAGKHFPDELEERMRTQVGQKRKKGGE
jgi:hypothetical protein